MELYLFHLASRTLICKPRHTATIRDALYHFAGMEYRLVRYPVPTNLSFPHVDLDDKLMECPHWLLSDNLMARRQEVREWVALKDEARDYESLVSDMESNGLLRDDYIHIMREEPDVPFN